MPRCKWTTRIKLSMTDQSLFKQAARRIVQRGQMPDGPVPAIGQAARLSANRPPGRADERQMGDARSGADLARQIQAGDQS